MPVSDSTAACGGTEGLAKVCDVSYGRSNDMRLEEDARDIACRRPGLVVDGQPRRWSGRLSDSV